MQAIDEIGLKKRQQDIATSEDNRAKFKKNQEQCGQPYRDRSGQHSGRRN
jgi:hypothetical protein